MMPRLFLACVVLAVCIGYAASLAVMSIDVGNEFMKIGLVKPGVPMEIVLNTDSQRKSATAVSMRNQNEREFGNPAMNTAVRYPDTAFLFLRDLLAKNTSNPIVKTFQKRFPYYTLEDDADRATMNFVHPDGNKYSVEELLAMILESAKHYAEKFAEQPISDAVIVCPAYFNQAERRALIRSTELAGLKVLQLMNTHAAVALNYGVFRRKEFNSTAQNYMFFDMGSISTTVTIVSYQVVKMKVGTIVETNPQLTVKGVGVDRTLGGLEITLRLRDHLAKLFNAQKKTTKDVTENKRSMAKLHKEAERVKKILSANSECFAQVENLIDDQDFKAQVSRDMMEKMCADIFERISKPVKDALASSEITMGEISEVILMGGGTRVPKVQENLIKVIGREELGKSINTDEAAALGAVYQAAHLSTGFKVKMFGVKDANLYPIQVDFERTVKGEDGTASTKSVKRTLFNRNNPYPQKKVMTFNKHTDDFDFEVNYGDMSFLSESEMSMFGAMSVSQVKVEGVGEEIKKQVNNVTECKGIKAHFNMDGSGLLQLDNIEVVFEKSPEAEEQESTLSKLSNTISSFFKSNTDESANPTEGEKSQETATDEKQDSSSDKKKESPSEEKPEETGSDKTADSEKKTEDSGSNEKTKEEQSDNKNKTEQTAPVNGTEAKNETVAEKKPVIIKRTLIHKLDRTDLKDPDQEHVTASKTMINEFKERDLERQKLAAIQNELEAFGYDIRNKLYEDVHEQCSTDEEREKILSTVNDIMDWYDEQENAPFTEFESKLKEAKDSVKTLQERVTEFTERPKVLDALKSTLNHTKYMLRTFQNFSMPGADEDDKPFTDVEIQTIDTLYNDTKDWLKSMKKEQSDKKCYDTPAFTVQAAAEKIRDLDREIRYLLNKAKSWRPRPPKTPVNETKTTNETESQTTTDDSEQTINTAADDAEKEAAPTQEEAPPTPEKTPPPQEETPPTEKSSTEEAEPIDTPSTQSNIKDSEETESRSEPTTEEPHNEL